jgi:hypothetical protein
MLNTNINPRVGPQAARLALKLVEWHYGELVEVSCCGVPRCLAAPPLARRAHRSPTPPPRFAPLQHVAEALVRHGRQTRRELYQSGIPLADLDLALAVLIQQNLVNVYTSDAQREDERYLYEAAQDRMLQIIR